jgi:hypothetical protein
MEAKRRKTALHPRVSPASNTVAGPAATVTGIPLVFLLVLILGTSAAAALECPDDLPVHDGSLFSLSIFCSVTELTPTITVTDPDNEFFVFSDVSCVLPNGTEQNDGFLDYSLISVPEFADTTDHSYPLGTVCYVTGCYTNFFNHPQKTLQNASCTVSQPSSPVMSTPSSSLSPSTSHPPPSHPIPTTTVTASSSPSLLPSSTLQVRESSLSTSAKGAQSHRLAAIVACVASLVLLCILLLVVGWYHSRTHRKVIKVGANNWRVEDLKGDYLPVDLCKPLVPAFTSHESLINNLYTPEPTSCHSLTPAPLPLTSHPAQPPTTDKQTHHNSFLRELSPVREGEVGGGGGKGGLTGEIVGVGEETSSGGATSSSGNTSGYSTRSSDSDNQQHESGPVEEHAKLQPDGLKMESDLDIPTTSSSVIPTNSDSSAGCETVETANLLTSETETANESSLATSSISDITEKKPTLPEPSLADGRKDKSSTSAFQQPTVASNTSNSPSFRSSLTCHEKLSTSECKQAVEKAEENPVPSLQDTNEGRVGGNPQSLNVEEDTSQDTVVEEEAMFETDVPPTPTTSEQHRARLLFGYLQRTSAARGSFHQHQRSASSPSSSGNGSGSLVDYAGYLHL